MPTAKPADVTAHVGPSPALDRKALQQIAIREATLAGLPFALVDTVMKIESDYQSDRIGGVGEIGLMQVRPTTAEMLGFHGSTAELADPSTNIHYGAAYLGTAWRLAKGNVCRTLMKYRAGHGNETMTPLSVGYCQRAQTHLASIGSPLAATITPADLVADASSEVVKPVGIGPVNRPRAIKMASNVKTSAEVAFPAESLTVAGRPKTGPAFWAAFQTRIKRINTDIEAKWRRTASR